ncbi:response regulator [Luteococcus sp. OSA5]|uniref:response regulator n=1 Tax=Luteococcus sp. OSA5 TaxID=3401630 RepID=UPI003B437DC5
MRVVIADDAVLVREGLRLLLTDAGHEVVAVGDAPALVRAALELRPDIVVSDIRMPPSHSADGLSAAVEIRAHWPQMPIVMLSQYVVLDYARELVGGGGAATGYLLKDRISDIDAFLAALDQVAAGGFVIDPELLRQIFATRADHPVQQLTPRELEVLELMARGLSNKAIADELVVTEGAVEKHIQHIFAKLGLVADADTHRRVSAVLALLDSGLAS